MNFIINYTNLSGCPHRHKNYEIIVCTDGEGVFHCEDFNACMSKGAIFIIPPDTMHYVTSDSNIGRIYINGELNQFFNFNSSIVIPATKNSEGLSIAQMIYDNRHSDFEYVNALTNALLHFLLRNIKIDNRIHTAIKEISNRISAEFNNCDLSLTEVLNESGYSEDYIRAQFKYITGKTPTEFLTSVRITHACYLIDTYKNTVLLSDIAEQCGYTDYVYFSKKFKQITGISPRKYTEMVDSDSYVLR